MKTAAPEQKYKGFLHMKCAHCGEIKTFCAKVPIDHYACKCGWHTPLKSMRQIGFLCECGKWFEYRTNLEDEIITMECFSCGSPIDLEWHQREQKYVRMR